MTDPLTTRVTVPPATVTTLVYCPATDEEITELCATADVAGAASVVAMVTNLPSPHADIAPVMPGAGGWVKANTAIANATELSQADSHQVLGDWAGLAETVPNVRDVVVDTSINNGWHSWRDVPPTVKAGLYLVVAFLNPGTVTVHCTLQVHTHAPAVAPKTE